MNFDRPMAIMGNYDECKGSVHTLNSLMAVGFYPVSCTQLIKGYVVLWIIVLSNAIITSSSESTRPVASAPPWKKNSNTFVGLSGSISGSY